MRTFVSPPSSGRAWCGNAFSNWNLQPSTLGQRIILTKQFNERKKTYNKQKRISLSGSNLAMMKKRKMIITVANYKIINFLTIFKSQSLQTISPCWLSWWFFNRSWIKTDQSETNLNHSARFEWCLLLSWNVLRSSSESHPSLFWVSQQPFIPTPHYQPPITTWNEYGHSNSHSELIQILDLRGNYSSKEFTAQWKKLQINSTLVM